MEIVLDIKDKTKVPFLMELLKSLPYVKVKTKNIPAKKPLLLEELQQAVEELKLIREGKLKGIPINELLDEL